MIPVRHVHTLPHFLSKCFLHHMSVADRPGHLPARPALQACTPAGPARPAGLDSGHLPARPACAWLALCDLVPVAWVTSDRHERCMHCDCIHQATRKGGGVAAVYRVCLEPTVAPITPYH